MRACACVFSFILPSCAECRTNPKDPIKQLFIGAIAGPIAREVFSTVFRNSTTAAAVAAAAVTAPVALAAITPPPLQLFPPQGLPQPTATGAPPAGGVGGGGALPSSAITVSLDIFV